MPSRVNIFENNHKMCLLFIRFAEINECDFSPCMHGDTCKDLSADYNCTCAPGYTGKNCSVGKGSCDSDIKEYKIILRTAILTVIQSSYTEFTCN